MFAQCDRQPDGTYLVTGSNSHDPSEQGQLPEGRLFAPLPDGVFHYSGYRYDPATKVYTPPAAVTRTRVSKVAFLAVIPPALFKAWVTSTDQTLMYGKALFDADTSVDVTNPAIAAVFAQALVLQLIDAPTAAALQQQIAALVK